MTARDCLLFGAGWLISPVLVSVLLVLIPGYQLEEPIGFGATGEVYRARRTADGAEVAIKVLHGQVVANDVQYRERLATEARQASAVNHTGVVQVHEVGGDDQNAWLVMDLVPGPDLQRLLDKQGPLSPRRATDLLTKVADAVAAVHATGVVHRDLKPANILLNGDEPLVADFGVARADAAVESALGIGVTGDTDWTHTARDADLLGGVGVGTVSYMAPEQWRGERGDARTDVYALGGVLYTALTARRPYEQRSLPELAYAVAISDPPAPSASGAPPAFDMVVATAMAKNPDDRYPDARTFAEAVRVAAAGQPSRATPPARRPAGRRLIVAVALVTLAIVAAGLLVWRPWAAPSIPMTNQKVVCGQTVTVRDAPRSHTVIETLYRDQRIEVLQDVVGPWVRVRLPDGRQGWVLATYIATEC